MKCWLWVATGGVLNLDITTWQHASNSTVTFSTKGKAKAFLLVFARTDGYTNLVTNINPNTGEIGEDLYGCYSKPNILVQNWQLMQYTVTITDNTLTCSAIMGVVTDQILMYIY